MRTSPSIRLESLESRTVPAVALPAGELNWLQFAPNGTLARLIVQDADLFYETFNGSGWNRETVYDSPYGGVTEPLFASGVHYSVSKFQMVFSPDGTAHVFALGPGDINDPAYSGLAMFSRENGQWSAPEAVPIGDAFNQRDELVAAVGPDGSFHLVFEEYQRNHADPFTGGIAQLSYVTNADGEWKKSVVAPITQDQALNSFSFVGEDSDPRYISLAVDSQNKAHIAYSPAREVIQANAMFSTAFSQLVYATNRTGSFQSEVVYQPSDRSGDAGLGASIALIGDQPHIAHYFVKRAPTGSPANSSLMFSARGANGWNTSVVTASPSGYVSSDGPRFTGYQPQLLTLGGGVPSIVFTDHATFHIPTGARERVGNVRQATLTPSGWAFQTILPQTDPIHQQALYPVAAVHNGAIAYGAVVMTSAVDGNNEIVQSDYAIFSQPPQNFVPPPPDPGIDPNAPGIGVVAAGAGGGPIIKVYADDGTVAQTITAFEESFTGGVRIASADLDGDGFNEVIAVPGSGHTPLLRIFDGKDGTLELEEMIFETSFQGGLFVAVGDLNGDGVADIAVSPDEGGGPRVRLFDGTNFVQINDFFGIEDPNFRGGARPAIGDVTGDGTPDLLVAAGFGGGPRLAVFDGGSLAGMPVKPFEDFFVFEQTLRNGVFIASGDLDGDAFAEVIAGGGPGGGPRIYALSGKDLLAGSQVVRANFFSGDVNQRGGVRLSTMDADGDNRADLIAAAGPGTASVVVSYLGKDITPEGEPTIFRRFESFPGLSGGVFVG